MGRPAPSSLPDRTATARMGERAAPETLKREHDERGEHGAAAWPNPSSHAQRPAVWLLRGTVPVALLALLAAGCTSSSPNTPTPSQPDAAPPSAACSPSNGLLTRDTVRCRLLHNSDLGAYPRRLSVADADVVVDALERYSAAVAAHQDRGMAERQYSAIIGDSDRTCMERTGVLCLALLFGGSSP